MCEEQFKPQVLEYTCIRYMQPVSQFSRELLSIPVVVI